MDAHGLCVDDLGAIVEAHGAAAAPAGERRVVGSIEVELDRRGIEHGPVLKLHAGTELERVHLAIGRHGPTRRQPGLELLVLLVTHDERIEDLEEDDLRRAQP
jgi:hypothetical protein